MELNCSGSLFAATLFAAILFCSPQPTTSQTPARGETEESCGKFVQSFYDWYLGKTPTAKLSSRSALERKPEVFSDELRRRLKQDFDAQANSSGELVGLDFDPILNSQDPSPHFIVVGVTRKGASYWVDVYGVDSSKRQEHVVPELTQRNGRWIFVNFHYGKSKWSDDENLLTLLKNLRAERAKNSQ